MRSPSKAIHEELVLDFSHCDRLSSLAEPRAKIANGALSRTAVAPEPAPPREDDPFTRRKLDLPRPKSLAELLTKLTTYEHPMLPINPINGLSSGKDGDLLTFFKGYYEQTPGLWKRIHVGRTTKGVSVSLEKGEGKFQDWSEKQGTLQLRNFNRDPYSLVIFLNDKRFLYLKFETAATAPALKGRKRAMTGWLMSETNVQAKIGNVAAIDSSDDVWPPLEVLMPLMPHALPPK